MIRLQTIRRGTMLLSAIAIATPLALGAQTTPPPAAPVRPAAIPPFQQATLPNGLRVLLVESRRQPVVSLALMMRAGSSHDPVGKEGLSSLVSSLITKGAASRTADQISAAIEGVGGSIGVFAGPDFMTVRSSALANDAPLAFELVGDVVTEPAFAEREVELARTQTLSGLQLELSQPGQLASRFFARELYGPHPYARRATPAAVRAITRDDLRSFQRTHLVPDGALLVVAGDMTLARATELARQHFGNWTGKAQPVPASARRLPPARTRTEILLVHRPGSVQSNMVVGNLTYPPPSPAHYAMTVANKVLGGGTDAKLFSVLREQKGWTYGAYSSVSRLRDISSISATAEVRTAVTDSALVELLKLERSLATTPLTPKELESAKSALVGSLPLQIETAQQVAEQVGSYTMLGLPGDYVRTLRPRLAAVTAAEVQRAARDYMRTDRAVIVVVGDGAQIYEKLASIAPTRIVNAQGDPMTPADLAPRATSLPVDVTKLVERNDSSSVLVQGNAMGSAVTRLARSANGFTFTSNLAIGPFMAQNMVAQFNQSLVPATVKGTGQIQGQPLSVDLTYANGRVKGTASVPGPQGMKTVNVDTAIAAGVIDANMLGALIPGLRWAPNAKFTVQAFDGTENVVRTMNLSVTGTESVTVPAGTFEAYRVEMTGGQAPIVMHITTAQPHRVVKTAPGGAPVEFVLVK